MTERWHRASGAPDEPTYTVAELGGELHELLGEAYASIWVAGEIHRARPSQRGHLYFELVEKGAGDAIVGKVDAVLWRTDHMRVRRDLRGRGLSLAEGQEIRCRAQLDFYPPAGRLQLVVREVDPYFTLGSLARRRQETLEALTRAGLLERNRTRPLPAVPLDLLLVTSHGSAAYHDFMSGLATSGYGFRVVHLAAAVQGLTAEAELIAAFRRIETGVATPRPGFRPAAVILVRGGGARSDLAVFDSRALAEAVARCSLPVLAGLGHETDRSVVDRVAHAAFKTPSEVASYLVERVAAADRELTELRRVICRVAATRVTHAAEALGRTERIARAARSRIDLADRRLRDAGRTLERVGRRRLRGATRAVAELRHRLIVAGPRLVERQRPRASRRVERSAERLQARLARLVAVLDGHARLCAELSPERLLTRGFSITRDATGTVVRDPRRVTAGDGLSTRVAGGKIASTVTATEERT